MPPSAKLEEVALHPWEEASERYESAKKGAHKRDRNRPKIKTEINCKSIEEFLRHPDAAAAYKLLRVTDGVRVLAESPRRGNTPSIAIAMDGEGLFSFHQVCGFTAQYGTPKPERTRIIAKEALEKIRELSKVARSVVSMSILYMAFDNLADKAP